MKKVMVYVITEKAHKTKLHLITITRRVLWRDERIRKEDKTNDYKLVFKGYHFG